MSISNMMRIAAQQGDRKIHFKPGFVLATEFSATGGVQYVRENVREETAEDHSQEAEFRTVRKVDHVDLVKESKSIVNKAYYVLERHATHTPIGYYVDEATLAKVQADMEEVRASARLFNQIAHSLNSARRVEIEIYPLELNLSNEHAAQRLVRTIQERLTRVLDALRAGDRSGYESAWETVRNLENLATGIQRDAIRFALERAKEAKSELLEAIRAGFDPQEAGKHLDLEAIEVAVMHFTGDSEHARA